MRKHTPGPWSVIDGNKDVIAGNKEDFCPIQGCGCCGSPWVSDAKFSDTSDEAKANARLIAAAPDLLEALKIAASYMESMWFQIDAEYGSGSPTNDQMEKQIRSGEWPEMSAIRAAIAKATGDTHA